VVASTEVKNILRDTDLERAPGWGEYHVFAKHAASVGTLVLSAYDDGAEVARKLPMVAAAGTPIKPDNHIVSFPVAPGDPIRIALEETAGTATIPNVRVEFQPGQPALLAQKYGG
jgi:hypothetical protein